jgi:hypothetical protein
LSSSAKAVLDTVLDLIAAHAEADWKLFVAAIGQRPAA